MGSMEFVHVCLNLMSFIVTWSEHKKFVFMDNKVSLFHFTGNQLLAGRPFLFGWGKGRGGVTQYISSLWSRFTSHVPGEGECIDPFRKYKLAEC